MTIPHIYVHVILIQEISHRKLKPLIAVFKVTYKVRNTATSEWLCLFRVDCCAVCILMCSNYYRHASLSTNWSNLAQLSQLSPLMLCAAKW